MAEAMTLLGRLHISMPQVRCHINKQCRLQLMGKYLPITYVRVSQFRCAHFMPLFAVTEVGKDDIII